MSDQIVTRREGHVAVLMLHRPPGNALADAVRQAVAAALSEAIADPQIRAIVLGGEGGTFSSGANLAELGKDSGAPSARDLAAMIEASPKPVICALEGQAQGAGLEIALAAHARIAARDAQLSLPDIRQNLPPGAGATQRLPRLLRVGFALEWMLGGHSHRADHPDLAPLFAGLTDGAPLQAALDLAGQMVVNGPPERNSDLGAGLTDPEGYRAALSKAVQGLGPEASPAARDIIRSVEAAQMLPFEQGVAFEAARYDAALTRPAARAARHLAIAEHRALHPPKGLPGRAADHVAFVGNDGLTGELAACCLRADMHVTVMAEDALAARRLRTKLEGFCQRVSPAKAARRLDRLRVAIGEADLSQTEIVFDAGQFEIEDPGDLSDQTIWVSLRDGPAPDFMPPARHARVYLMRPAHRRLVGELGSGQGTGATETACLLASFARIGMRLILTPLAPGTVLGRLGTAFDAAGAALVQHHIVLTEVDAAAKELGFATGPCARMDRSGLQSVIDGIARWYPAGQEVATYLEALKIVSGTDTIYAALAEEESGAEPPAILQSGAGTALMAALVNEAATLLDEGAVARASDLDLLLGRGLGFDAHRGGPLFEADAQGLFGLYRQMKELSQLSPIWAPSPALDRMIANGDGFFQRIAEAQLSLA